MRRSSHWGGYAVLTLVGLGLALAHVWTRLQVMEVGYKLSSAQQLVDSLEGERQALMLEWSALTTPRRLAQQASRRLGMAAPLPEQVVRLP